MVLGLHLQSVLVVSHWLILGCDVVDASVSAMILGCANLLHYSLEIGTRMLPPAKNPVSLRKWAGTTTHSEKFSFHDRIH